MLQPGPIDGKSSQAYDQEIEQKYPGDQTPGKTMGSHKCVTVQSMVA